MLELLKMFPCLDANVSISLYPNIGPPLNVSICFDANIGPPFNVFICLDANIGPLYMFLYV